MASGVPSSPPCDQMPPGSMPPRCMVKATLSPFTVSLLICDNVEKRCAE